MTTYSNTYAPASAATTADYADALLTARRAKTTLFVLLLLLILGQLILFFLTRYDAIDLGVPAQRVPAAVTDAVGDAAAETGAAIGAAGRAVGNAAEQTGETIERGLTDAQREAVMKARRDAAVDADPAVTVTPVPDAPTPDANPLSADNEVKGVVGRVGDPAAPAASAGLSSDTAGLVAYALGFTTFLGIVFAVVLTLVVLLILLIILNSRAYGASAVTSAFVWMLMLLVLIFPWYAFLNYGAGGGAGGFRIPGVLYTWPELLAGVRFPDDFSSAAASAETILKWARFVGFPLLALALLVVVQVKSGRGVREALGEADVRRDGVVEEERVNV